MDEAIAHVAEDGRIHPLAEHLRGTAERAAAFAGEFGCGEWGRLAGLWHDLGKYSEKFQQYIRSVNDPDTGGRGLKHPECLGGGEGVQGSARLHAKKAGR